MCYFLCIVGLELLDREIPGAAEGGNIPVRGGYWTVVRKHPGDCPVPEDVPAESRRSCGTGT